MSQSMHEMSACKPRTVQPFLVAVLTFGVSVCRRFDQAPCQDRFSRSATFLSKAGFEQDGSSGKTSAQTFRGCRPIGNQLAVT